MFESEICGRATVIRDAELARSSALGLDLQFCLCTRVKPDTPYYSPGSSIMQHFDGFLEQVNTTDPEIAALLRR